MISEVTTSIVALGASVGADNVVKYETPGPGDRYTIRRRDINSKYLGDGLAVSPSTLNFHNPWESPAT